MLLKPIDETKSPKREDLDELNKRILEWSEDADTKPTLDECAGKTLAWLKTNVIKAGDDYKPWWRTLHSTTDAELLETRRTMLRSLSYDHGLPHYIRSVAAAGLVVQPLPEVYEELLQATSYFGFNQLLALSRLQVTAPEEYEKLITDNPEEHTATAIASAFGFSGAHPSQRFRPKMVRFGNVGMISASTVDDGTQSLKVELGPTGVAFFCGVFVPIINHMSIYEG